MTFSAKMMSGVLFAMVRGLLARFHFAVVPELSTDALRTTIQSTPV